MLTKYNYEQSLADECSKLLYVSHRTNSCAVGPHKTGHRVCGQHGGLKEPHCWMNTTAIERKSHYMALGV